jgi:hypothetical protein
VVAARDAHPSLERAWNAPHMTPHRVAWWHSRAFDSGLAQPAALRRDRSSRFWWTIGAVLLALFQNSCLVAIAIGMHYRKCVYDDDCNLGTVCVCVARARGDSPAPARHTPHPTKHTHAELAFTRMRRHLHYEGEGWKRQAFCIDCEGVVDDINATDRPEWLKGVHRVLFDEPSIGACDAAP